MFPMKTAFFILFYIASVSILASSKNDYSLTDNVSSVQEKLYNCMPYLFLSTMVWTFTALLFTLLQHLCFYVALFEHAFIIGIMSVPFVQSIIITALFYTPHNTFTYLMLHTIWDVSFPILGILFYHFSLILFNRPSMTDKRPLRFRTISVHFPLKFHYTGPNIILDTEALYAINLLQFTSIIYAVFSLCVKTMALCLGVVVFQWLYLPLMIYTHLLGHGTSGPILNSISVDLEPLEFSAKLSLIKWVSYVSLTQEVLMALFTDCGLVNPSVWSLLACFEVMVLSGCLCVQFKVAPYMDALIKPKNSNV